MKLVWKLSIPQICIVICFGLISYVVINSSFIKMREQYIQDGMKNRFQLIAKGVEVSAQEAVNQTSMFVNLSSVLRAYELAHSGDIDDPYSPQSQAARELLRKELAPMLDSFEEETGRKLQLHFHLPNGRSLARLWWEKNTRVDGKWTDVSDDLTSYRPTVMEVNRSGQIVMGIEPGTGGFAVRGVIPVKTPDGWQIGSAEVLHDFNSIINTAKEEGKLDIILYANEDLRRFSVELQNQEKYPLKGDFLRVTETPDDSIESLISAEFLSKGKTADSFENHGALTLQAFPITDYRGEQIGVIVFVMNTDDLHKLANTTATTMALMLAAMAIAPFGSLLMMLRALVTSPLNKMKTIIQDIVEDRSKLSATIPGHQKDEIGELTRWFNALTAKVGKMLDDLRDADQRMQSILDATPLCAFFMDGSFNIFYCNQVAAKIFELSDKKEYIEKFYELSPERQPCGKTSREMVYEYSVETLEKGYCRFEWVHQKFNGEPIPCEITLVRIKNRDNYIVAGYMIDLRERNAMLSEIRKESAKFASMANWYESILDATPLPVSVTDADMNLKFINKAFEGFFGIKRNILLGTHCSIMGVPACDTPECCIARAKRGEKQTFFQHNGRSLQIDIEIMKNPDDEIEGFIEIIQDITEIETLVKKQADAEAASKSKSVFLANMSHEIRTPMNAIIGITEIQLQNETLHPGVREAMARIYNSGNLLLGIINDILDLSKIEAGKMEIMPVGYNVASVINDIVQLNQLRVENKTIEFRLWVDENIPSTLIGDDLRIKQILNNLLSNAFKYTNKGEVSLSISAEYATKGMQDAEAHSSAAEYAMEGMEGAESYSSATGFAIKGMEDQVMLVFRISDTGQGMTDDQIRMLFNEYSRFNQEANRIIEGTGLGMTITQNLLRMMNGSISIKSEPGKGTTIVVNVPQKKDNADNSGVLGRELAEKLQKFRMESTLVTKQVKVAREPMYYGRVLIVDDVESNLYVARELMGLYGLSIKTVGSGYEAIDKIEEGEKYDIIFMDHMMPGIDGIEATRRIRATGYKHPVIALTANALVGQSDVFFANGFDGFISKPIDVRQLDEVLNRFIRDKQPKEVIEAARLKKAELEKHSPAKEEFTSSVDPELLECFAEDAEDAIAALENICANEYRRVDDIHIYVITVHGMKSALSNIGETELSGFALKLEQAGREKNMDEISARTPEFLDALRKLIGKINNK